ncbi:MAG: YicC/YloC family endoribonuclease [Thermonemataceae bacterium]|nr:YicC/YloC family endoribonuclease [Thermonemataceae bacterium]
MLQSMTGYGKAQKDGENFLVEVEIRSLNSKFLDLSLRSPKEMNEKELEIRNLAQDFLERGKIYLQIDFQRKSTNTQLLIDEEMLKGYYQNLERLKQELNAQSSDVFRLAVQMTENNQKNFAEGLSEEEWNICREAIVEALKRCKNFRLEEGNLLKNKFLEYENNIRLLLAEVETQDPKRLENIREKLHNRIKELKNDELFDKNRFEQELIYYIEKLDISEEKVRLLKHLDYLREVLQQSSSNGKKINFITQEIGREINTIGSKANDATIQRFVIEMKEELEKIKEQSLNIL